MIVSNWMAVVFMGSGRVYQRRGQVDKATGRQLRQAGQTSTERLWRSWNGGNSRLIAWTTRAYVQDSYVIDFGWAGADRIAAVTG